MGKNVELMSFFDTTVALVLDWLPLDSRYTRRHTDCKSESHLFRSPIYGLIPPFIHTLHKSRVFSSSHDNESSLLRKTLDYGNCTKSSVNI